jgi:hypoxanthine phosphoribosyltransferase
MDENLCIQEFVKLAERLGIEIRYTVDAPSGLCTVKGKQVLFIDKNLDTSSTLSLFIREMKTLKPLEGVFVVPLLRKHLGLEDETSEW